MLFRWRNPGSRAAAGAVSPSTMLSGTFQYGLNTVVVIMSLKMGVLFSGLPTTTFICSAVCPPSCASRWNDGMFTMM